VWNDSTGLGTLPTHPGLPPLLDAILQALTGLSPDKNYRPLGNFISSQAAIRIGRGELSIDLWLAWAALVVGAAASAMFAVSVRLLGRSIWSLIATILLLCSPAFLTANWIVISAQHAVVPLFMCWGVLLYWRILETVGWRRALSVIALAAILLLGPWYREFLGVVSVLVMLEELRRARRPTLIMGLGALGFLHGLFPMLLPKLLLDPGLPLIPVNRIGDAAVQLDQSMVHLRWDVLPHFLDLLPPSLFVIALTGFAARSWLSAAEILRQKLLPPATDNFSLVRALCADRAVLPAAVIVGLLPLVFVIFVGHIVPTDTFEIPTALLLIFPLGVFGFSVSPLLCFWFFLTLLPFLRVFTNIVHLNYPLVPAAIIVAAGLRAAWDALVQHQGVFAQYLRKGFATVIVLLVLDQALNLYGVRLVVQATNEGMAKVAETLRQRVPRGAVIVGNAIHLFQVELDSSHWFQSYFSVDAGVGYRSAVADNPDKLAALAAAHVGTTYLLDIDQPYPPSQYLYHSHQFVRTQAIDWIDLGSLHTTRATYPFIDPLHHLVSSTYTPFLSNTDLTNDFYHGPALNHAWFLRETYVDYHLYRVTGNSTALLRPQAVSFVRREGTILDMIGGRMWERTGAFPQELAAASDRPRWVSKYVLATGNDGIDATGRMPKSWTFYGSPDGQSWDEIDRREHPNEWQLNERQAYALPNPGLYRYFRMRIDAGFHPSILRIYRLSVLGQEDAGQSIEKATERIDYFWEKAGPFPIGMQFDFPAPTKAFRYGLAAGPYDEADFRRMPTQWELFGSNDGQSWTSIDTRTEQGGWRNREVRIFRISDPGEYTHYRFVFFAANFPILRIQDIWLLGTPAAPTGASPASPG
jgi:hypothetical protein